jgi:hypothetical protein
MPQTSMLFPRKTGPSSEQVCDHLVISWGSSHLLILFGYGLCTEVFPFSDCCKGKPVRRSLVFFFFIFKKVLYPFNYLSVLFIYLYIYLYICIYIYIYICNIFGSRAKTKPNFKNQKTQNTL